MQDKQIELISQVRVQRKPIRRDHVRQQGEFSSVIGCSHRRVSRKNSGRVASHQDTWSRLTPKNIGAEFRRYSTGPRIPGRDVPLCAKIPSNLLLLTQKIQLDRPL